MKKTCLVCTAAFMLMALTLHSKSNSTFIAVKNARIYPVTSPVIPSGALVVKNGKILAVGKDVCIPDEAEVIDAAGRTVMPGIIESHSHMCLEELWRPVTYRNNNELSKPFNAEVRAIDGIRSNDRALEIAVSAGVTTQCILTGSRSPNSGQAAVLKMRSGTARDMYLSHGGMKFAFRSAFPDPCFPQSVLEAKELLRKELKSAQNYLLAWESYHSGKAGSQKPARDLKLEALGKVLTREWIVGAHANTADQMRAALELKKEFNLDLYIIHGLLDMVDEMLKEGIPACYGPLLPHRDRENQGLEKVARFIKMGGQLSFQQDHPDGHQYYLRPAASLFVRKGLSEEDALKALTINPANLLRLGNRIGSLEKGKDADFLILSGPPLEIESLVEQTFVEGREVFNRSTGFNIYQSQ